MHPWIPGVRARALAWALVCGAATAPWARASETGAAVGALSCRNLPVDPGELLVGELNCAACHRAEGAAASRLDSKQAPRLGGEGLALTPQFLKDFLSNPSAAAPGTTMPDLLRSLSGEERERAADAMAHFIESISPAANPNRAADSFWIEQGRRLYHSIGCVACHAPEETPQQLKAPAGDSSAPAAALERLRSDSVPLGPVAEKYTVDQLARFLIDPVKYRPSGRMPSLKLRRTEATAIAMYLLRDQARNSAGQAKMVKGLSYQYFEGRFADNPNFENARPAGAGAADHFTIAPRKRAENVGLRLSGFIHIGAAGRYTFYTLSDDGSRLYLDSKLVVQNDGEHSAAEREGSAELAPGNHPILVAWFNAGGPAELKVSYQGPGIEKREIPAAVLFHLGAAMTPLRSAAFALDPQKAREGEKLFRSLGCAACHGINGALAIAQTPMIAPPLARLDGAKPGGCIGENPKPGLPAYSLTARQRAAIRSWLSRAPSLAALTAGERAAHKMAALNCYACHIRGKAGGPTPERAVYFASEGDVDMGDEGRLPPHLNGVGAKLRPDWLLAVLVNQASVRPYMMTRMPQFGAANVEPLVPAFIEADRRPATAAAPADSALAKYGRKLAGTTGLSCISCHIFAGHKSLGIPAIDLTYMPRRLEFDWFRRYLLDPQSLRPGTRMPTFWPEGKSANQQILGGDTQRQIEAIWEYLSVADKAGLPDGLIQGRMELVATNEAIIYRNFIAGVSPRGIGVGYPEKANLAFDAQELFLGLIWQGPFIDAARHRTGRGEGFEPPLGYNVQKLVAGPPFALLGSPESPWPASPSRAIGYRFRGYFLDHERRPKFMYSYQNIDIDDYPVAMAGDLEPYFRRAFELTSPAPVPNLYFRAAASRLIEAKNGGYLIDRKVLLRFNLPEGAQPIIRRHDGVKELIVPVLFNGNKADFVEEIIW